ncbi:MAG: hypothetical protein CVU39_11485 [Chloroflexi bacterium HGW-Chloroflexi-10]|nr:MAG: hypothetical protein CVU39_11485 [Chloroflexi bacterium HGW-Chloroflexi-10]
MLNKETKTVVPDLNWYQEIVKEAPETIIIIDRDGRILFHNDHAEGADPAQFVNRNIFEFFLPEYYDLVRSKIKKVFDTGQTDSYELASTYNESDPRWYMTNLGPIIRDGRVVAVSLFIRNTTEIKRAQRELKVSNENLEKRVDERTQTLNEYAYRLEVSEKLNVILRRAQTRQEVINSLVGHCMSVMEADLAGIYETIGEELQLSISIQHTEAPPHTLNADNDHFLFRMLHVNKIHHILLDGCIEEDCQFCCYMYDQKTQALILAPLRIGGYVAGILYIGWKTPRQYSQEDEQLLNAFVESGSNTLHRIWATEQLEHNIRQREQELHVLYQIMSIASEELDADTLLEKSLNTTLKAVNCLTGLIHLFNSREQKLESSIQEQVPDGLYDWLLLTGLDQELWGQVFQTGGNVLVSGLQTKMDSGKTELLTYFGVPIRTKEVIIGVLSIFCKDEGIFDSGVKQLISTIADQIGLALETTRQRQRDKEALILEERQRLARDLHDSVSQSLYGLVLSADISKKLLKLKELSTLEETINDIATFALQSLREMRLMLFELRPLAFESEGLSGALELRLNTVERRAGLMTSLDIVGEEFLPSPLDLELYRITTEALNNALRHSNCTQIQVSLHVDEVLNQLELKIIDNGQGFSIENKSLGGIGLVSMKERATRLGGQLVIETEDTIGTTVRLVCPTKNNNKGIVK